MTTVSHSSPRLKAATQKPWLDRFQPIIGTALRWLFLVVCTAVAFRHSIASLVDTARAGGLNGYLLLVPAAAALAAVGIARRPHRELPIHDRQTDVIVGAMGLGLALMLQWALLGRYTGYFHILRIDVLALWTFVLSSCVMLFGLRPVTRYLWVWVLVFISVPLPYHVLVITLGGTELAAGAATVGIAWTATAIAVGRTLRRAVVGALNAAVAGFLMLGVVALIDRSPNRDVPLFAYQFIPPLVAILVVGVSMYLHARRGTAKRLLDRQIEPLAASQVWAALPVVAAVAVALSLVPMPQTVNAAMVKLPGPARETEPTVPAGWRQVETEDFPWVTRVYGREATLVRQRLQADAADPRFDTEGRARTVMVDTVTTAAPFELQVYPIQVMYPLPGARISAPRVIDLGHGVHANLISIVDERRLLTWVMMSWRWTDGQVAQQISVLAVDNHRDDAPFPQPTGSSPGETSFALLTILLRGNSAASHEDPDFKDRQLLELVSTQIVANRMAPAGGAS